MQIVAANNLCHTLSFWYNVFKYKSIIVIVWFFFLFYSILKYVKISFGQSCISNLIFVLYIHSHHEANKPCTENWKMLISLTKAQDLIYKVRDTFLFIIKQGSQAYTLWGSWVPAYVVARNLRSQMTILPVTLSFRSLHETCLLYQHNPPTSCFLFFFTFYKKHSNESEMCLLDDTFELLTNQSNSSKFEYLHFDTIIWNFKPSQILRFWTVHFYKKNII